METVPTCPVKWAEQKQLEAARLGNLQDFENYQEIAVMWERKLGL